MELIFPRWQAPDHIKAFTSTRYGGCSNSPYDSLNVGDHVGDDAVNVALNREKLIKKVKEIFGVNDFLFSPNWLRQEHTITVSTDEKPIFDAACDGQFTRTNGIVCTIMTADCLPVFISNRAGTEIALVHAGWRGLADGIVEKTLSLFSAEHSDLLVHCGPAITQENFEIGNEVRELLGGSKEFYKVHPDKKGHCFADLMGLLGERVHALGVEYTCSNLCTYSDRERFFSYRRENNTGRIVSMIWIQGTLINR